MERLAWICLAGAVGTGTRYLIGVWASERWDAAFPYATLIVNLAGCLLLGLAMQASLAIASIPPTVRLAITTGFLGGLTTYSTFNYETTKLLQDGGYRVGLVNLGVTVVGCFAAGIVGMMLGRRAFGG